MYRVLDFTPDNFFGALATRECPVTMIESDAHSKYLFEYLQSPDLAAAAIVVEPDYVDRDYLEDFAAFYVSCFYSYDRFCTRIHFFKQPLTQIQFRRIIRGKVSKTTLQKFRESYLGFIVVRPLPEASIGRTQLRTYLPDGGRRNYNATRDYDVSLFGVALSVRSMAFQEQDRAVAACATVALWSCFQKTAELFGTAAPRPPVITADATSALYHRRSLPSTGLSTEQICSAIRQNGLDPEVFPQSAITPSLIYAYLRFGIPLLMIAAIQGYPEQNHAITLNGYSVRDTIIGEERLFAPSPSANPPRLGTAMVGRRINELYGHDDGIGPFSRLFVTMPFKEGWPFTMTGSWKVPGTDDDAVILPIQIIAPLYRKIRLSFAEAQASIAVVFAIAERLLSAFGFGRNDSEWDIYLTTTSQYKIHIRDNASLSQARRDYLLAKSQPRFFWQCTLRVRNLPVMEVGVDATEFSKSNPVFLMNHFDAVFGELFKRAVAAVVPGPGFHPHLCKVLLDEHEKTA